jgi:hypothetical protein
MFQISEDARIAKEKLAGLSKSIEIPKVFDAETFKKQKETENLQKSQQIEQTWTNFVERPEFLQNAFVEIPFYELDDKGEPIKDEKGNVIPPYLVWKYDEEFRQKAPKYIIKIAKDNNIPLTQESFGELLNDMESEYKEMMNHKIEKAKIKALREKWEEEYEKNKGHARTLKREEGTGSVKNDPAREYYENWEKEYFNV